MSELKVKEIACETAHEFVDYLRLSKEHWGDLSSSYSPWLFRGQTDSEWEMIPSLYRENAIIEDLKENTKRNFVKQLNSKPREFTQYYNSIREQWRSIPNSYQSFIYYFLEKKLLHDFLSSADYNAFEIPELDDLGIYDPISVNNKNFRNDIENAYHTDITLKSEDFKQTFLTNKKFEVKAYMGLAQHHGIYTRLIDMTYNH